MKWIEKAERNGNVFTAGRAQEAQDTVFIVGGTAFAVKLSTPIPVGAT